jgi:hypothetical protein
MLQVTTNPTTVPTTDVPTTDVLTAVEGPTRGPATPSRRDWQAVSLALGGVLFIVGNLLHPLEHSDEAYHASTWEAAHLTIFASIPLIILGLPALQRRLAGRVGPRLATWPIVASIIGLIGIAPGAIIETFVARMIGHEAMHQLESGGMGIVNAICGLGFIGGAAALGWAAHRARLRPRWAGPSIIVAAAVLVGVMNATGPAAGVAIIGATVVYGAALTALAVGKG